MSPMPPQAGPPQGGPPPGGPPQGGPPQGQEGGPEDVMKAMKGVQDALNAMVKGLEGSAPPEAMKLLTTAADSFNRFIEIVSGGGGEQPAGPPQPADSMAGNNPNARPVQ